MKRGENYGKIKSIFYRYARSSGDEPAPEITETDKKSGNLSFLRPNYAKAVADVVKELGGRPFLTDCNTLYVGRRKDALEHLGAAYENGFNILSTGCHVLIGDGLKGTDEVYVPVEGGEFVKEAKIGHAVMDADIFISLSHFKGHELAGFGGCLKNIGMGCASRAG